MLSTCNDYLRPIHLKTELRENPLGIDENCPSFSWRLDAKGKNIYQSAYRIIVTDEAAAVVWDTGKILSSRQLEIAYEGVPLQSTTRYYWKVMVWNQKDNPSSWSEEAFFETAFLTDSDWKAQWIGGNSAYDPMKGLSWIGSTENVEASFEKIFYLKEGVQQVVLDAAAYSEWKLYCNGVLRRWMNTQWKQDFQSPIRHADLTEFFAQGKNTIRFEVTGGSYGTVLAARLTVRYADGTEEQIVSDESWKDRTNTAGIVGRYGDAPWGVPKRRGPAPLMRKEFCVSGAVERARLHICGLGYESSCLNGQPVSDGVLRGEYTQFHKTVYYNTVDVTALLRQGRNCLSAELGRGFYSFGKDWIGVMAEQDEPKLLAQLEIRYEDGTCQTICSDDSWQTDDGPTVDDNIWYGDKYDARLEQSGWDLPGFDASHWRRVRVVNRPGGTLKANFMSPIRMVEELCPMQVDMLSDKIRLYDFGKVTTGWVTICVNEPKGTRIRLRYGEKLLDTGMVDMESKNCVFQFWEPAQEDIYICRGGGEEVWTPKFSYKGYRYVEIEGLDHEISVTGQVLHNDLPQTGMFRCSNELFNQIHGLITPTILNNFHSIPTDTPTYEKRGWTGDGQSICDTALLNLDAQLFFRKWVQDLADSQNDDGAIPDTCPGPVYYPPAPEWMCAMVVVPYQLYLHCGDTQILKNYYSQMCRYTHYEIDRLKDGLSSNLHYGDWNSPAGACPPEGSSFNATCFVYYVCTMMRSVAGVLGEVEDEKYFEQAAGRIRDTLNSRFLDTATMLYHTEKQTGFRQTPTLLPLAFGIAPEEKQTAIAESLARNIRQKDDCHLSTGCMGLKFLAPTLTRFGYGDVADAIADRKDFPSWGYWLSKGATTCWEEWDTKARSYNHFYFGTIDDWFYRYLAGIQPVEAGYKRFRVKPYVCGSVTQAEARVNTPYGEIAVNWNISDGFRIEVSVPVNTTAEVEMPNGTVYVIGSGEYEFYHE